VIFLLVFKIIFIFLIKPVVGDKELKKRHEQLHPEKSRCSFLIQSPLFIPKRNLLFKSRAACSGTKRKFKFRLIKVTYFDIDLRLKRRIEIHILLSEAVEIKFSSGGGEFHELSNSIFFTKKTSNLVARAKVCDSLETNTVY